LATDHTIVLNWYMNPFTRVMFNYVAFIDTYNVTAGNRVTGGNLDILEARFGNPISEKTVANPLFRGQRSHDNSCATTALAHLNVGDKRHANIGYCLAAHHPLAWEPTCRRTRDPAKHGRPARVVKPAAIAVDAVRLSPKDCQLVCEVKKETKTCWCVEQQESALCCQGAHHDCDDCCQPLLVVGKPKCVKKLVKKEYQVEVPVYKCGCAVPLSRLLPDGIDRFSFSRRCTQSSAGARCPSDPTSAVSPESTVESQNSLCCGKPVKRRHATLVGGMWRFPAFSTCPRQA